ncbi:MAG TPA: DinB family protein [Candidatus Kapabacteria bacterium]|jgi:uncharacterized damage-inducible protein DinB|nr:DinB family protein [Candidatus Kapabacteria bacterium]
MDQRQNNQRAISQFANPLEALDKSFAVFVAVAENYPHESVREKPSAIGFSATEIVYHMLDVERLWQQRIRRLLERTLTYFEAMNPDREAVQNRYNEKQFDPGILDLAAARLDTHRLIRSLTKEQFELTGIHSKYGPMNIVRILEIMEEHDRTHAAQLDRTLAAIRSKSLSIHKTL